MKPYDRVLAEFRPRRTDDLKPGGAAVIGRVGVFEAFWVIGPDEDYAGECAMVFPREWGVPDAFWVPESDLRIIE